MPQMISLLAGSSGFGAFWQSSTELALFELLVALLAGLVGEVRLVPVSAANAGAATSSTATTMPSDCDQLHGCEYAPFLLSGCQPEMMNARTKPKSASASVNAMPRNIVVRTVPADSGWRAIAVMALPTTRPMPMPGPMAAPP